MASANVHEFTESNFSAEVLNSDKPVLVDFWAEWCMPCRMLTPTIEKIAEGAMGDHCHLSTPRQPTKAQYIDLIESLS